MLLFLVSAACFLLLRLGHLSHSNSSLAYTCESQVAFMSKTSKKLQPLADVTSPPYGSIGMVCMSNEEMDHLTSCFTNMVHFKLLQVNEEMKLFEVDPAERELYVDPKAKKMMNEHHNIKKSSEEEKKTEENNEASSKNNEAPSTVTVQQSSEDDEKV